MRPSAHDVIEAATELLTAVGLDGLSIRAIADRIDVHPAALLVDWQCAEHIALEVLNTLIGQVPIPTGGPWDKRLVIYMTDMGAMLMDFPDMALLWCRAGGGIGVNNLVYMDTAMGCLADGGFQPDTALEVGTWLHAGLLGWSMMAVEHNSYHHETPLVRERRNQAMHLLPSFANAAPVGKRLTGEYLRSDRVAGLHAMLTAWVAGLPPQTQ